MHKLAAFIVDKRGAALVVALSLLLAAVAVLLAGQVEQEDDLLAFMPRDNPDIALFQDVNRRFGGLDVAIVGIAVEDAYAPEVLERLQQLSTTLLELPTLDHVLSLTTVDDFSPDPMGGIRTGKLVEVLPTDEAGARALEAKVQARENVLGTLVSGDGKALVIYVFGGYGADARQVADQTRSAVQAAFPDAALYWGGNPFVSTYIYDTTQADVRRLTPWAVGTIVLIMLLAFRDVRGTLLGLGATGIGIASSQALMTVLGVKLNVVLGSMPIILFAVGSAYAIHMLARYQANARELSCPDAVYRTITVTGPTVVTAGLTTALGLGSFVVMDIEPMRIFGIFTAIGVVVTLVLSLTFVPAVIRLLELKPGNGDGPGPVARMLSLSAGWTVRHRLGVGAVLAVVVLVGAFFTARVDNRVDQRAFYRADSPPDLADRFLTERFGGSIFVQVLAQGDLNNPDLLRQLRLLADRIALVPHVHGVQHIGDVVATLNEAMEGQARIPDSAGKVTQLYGLLTGNPSVRQLATDSREQALLHIRLDTSDIDAVAVALAEIERLARDPALTHFESVSVQGSRSDEARARVQTLVEARVSATLAGAGLPVDSARIAAAVATRPEQADPAGITADLARFLGSDENFVELSPAETDALAAAFGQTQLGADADLAPLAAATLQAAATDAPADAQPPAVDPRVADLAWILQAPLSESRTQQLAASRAQGLLADLGVELPEGPAGARLQGHLATALMDLEMPTVALPPAGITAGPPALALSVNGLPVLHRGLSASTTRNQLLSLAFALGLVAVVLSWRFRSLASGLMATLPMATALLVVYGGMGALRIHLDIGTSMLASIVIGAGVDYAVHMMSAWYAPDDESVERAAARAAARTGPAIWINALMVAAGFFVLTLGNAQPLRNVGGLTAAAMITAALCTFLVLPVVARRRRYLHDAPAHDPADPRRVAAVLTPSESPQG